MSRLQHHHARFEPVIELLLEAAPGSRAHPLLWESSSMLQLVLCQKQRHSRALCQAQLDDLWIAL